MFCEIRVNGTCLMVMTTLCCDLCFESVENLHEEAINYTQFTPRWALFSLCCEKMRNQLSAELFYKINRLSSFVLKAKENPENVSTQKKMSSLQCYFMTSDYTFCPFRVITGKRFVRDFWRDIFLFCCLQQWLCPLRMTISNKPAESIPVFTHLHLQLRN